MLQLRGIQKSYTPETPALVDIDLTINTGEIVCLLGPSGCGKTTLLRIVAGLEKPDRGTVEFEGQDLAKVAVNQRNFGLMFQEFALFPHKTVGENIAFGLRMAKQSKTQIEACVDEMLALVDLEGYENRTVFELSGGERQRVALARSLAPNPRLLMLDEPLGSLDQSLREELMSELRTILKRFEVTALYVTHDQQEAFAIADRLVLMQQGRIEQVGRPEEIYARPANGKIARFLGLNNLIAATVRAEQPRQVETTIGTLQLASEALPGVYTLLIRPEAATLYAPYTEQMKQSTQKGSIISGTLVTYSFRGNHYRVGVEFYTPQQTILLNFELSSTTHTYLTPNQISDPARLEIGSELSLKLNPALLMLLDSDMKI